MSYEPRCSAFKEAICALQQVHRTPLLSSWNQQLQHAVFDVPPLSVSHEASVLCLTAAACVSVCQVLLLL